MIDRVRSESAAVRQPMPECWRIIGVAGDRSCPELEAFIHCRNCPVLAEAARGFFDRDAPEGYLDAWRTILEEPAEPTETADTSVLVFRVDQEWLALPTAVLVEVTPARALHTVPHRSGTALAGLVNIRGQLQLCMSLHRVLGLPGEPARAASAEGKGDEGTRRLVVVERPTPQGVECWVLGVDDVAGVHRVGRSDLRPVPSTVGQAAGRCSSAIFGWHGHNVALLDETRLLDILRDSVSA